MNINYKETLIEAAHAGGEILKKYFGQTLNLIEKSTASDFKTEADIGSESAILTILRNKFPKYNIHSEEEGKFDNGSEYTIIVDPLDGTNNFVLGIPNFSVSIAVVNNKETIAGVIYQPILNQTYFAEKNNGAELNGKKINVSNIIDPNNMTISYNCGYKTDRNRVAFAINNLIISKHKRIVFNWSPSYDYCLLASGKIEAIVTDPGTEVYDYTAGKLIALEAGAKIVYLNKEKSGDNFI
ncbi:hypothetical protein A2643_00890 [Candidatus Nomurabacteria bacterium RIFCSPHIGHO2_01_FULL_39_220]|uniref:Inositol-phosphate phosphatase n=1 Tax=Candidatus Nomurabacteria bacterium RIFCSPLOWO2_02_FULL_40_67 TaxID=1801787 RepID=A0A1F6Y5E9_9BACT|nr:MAG: Inositol-1-monophosphatase [Parcubacteria group bacterium GW2011_GWF2_42_7]OGI62939.1 MAG: hypothetical protein A2W12_03920 [Candidatus Nomurabacteria bacterium RBG_16_40_11]OGI70063.1 MAG: hypothetical protein A2643_00890 [Candidatus Nomurabacteria bacterium RIFCSPHIGHO2_01_FULL_39_220]OGI73056.1 MAG: hypothetical protein A2W56_00755 [Candidatus Nomurabacteria bacterium RIFCSPHIGHO2_02_41_18]OGI81580.1 MAG: hypothetical protein A3E03_02350 [Candidatus Nomurabacteria bacterium RIFCSPHIG